MILIWFAEIFDDGRVLFLIEFQRTADRLMVLRTTSRGRWRPPSQVGCVDDPRRAHGHGSRDRSHPATGWPAWPAARSPSPWRCWFTNSGTSRLSPRSDSPIRSCGTPLPGWSGSGEFGSLMRAGTWRLRRRSFNVAGGGRRCCGSDRQLRDGHRLRTAVRRFGPGPLSVVLGVGLVTPLRWLGAIPILVSRLLGRLRSPSNTDEGWLAVLTGIPESLLLLLGLTCLLLGYWFLVTAIPRGRRVGSSSRRWWAAWPWVVPVGPVAGPLIFP